MEKSSEKDQILLSHHVQQQLCETRLPYRQGRKLTAVKVYSIAKESNHLLIFGVPSLNLRKETKTLFMRFGKLLQFSISKDHAAESFTETYHAQYEKIQAARMAKRTLDTKNFYGGSLHICYAPEFESIMETHQKLMQRQDNVLRRLKNLKTEAQKTKEADSSITNVDNTINVITNSNEAESFSKSLLNMGDNNIIMTGRELKRKKRKVMDDVVLEKRFKPCFVDTKNSIDNTLDTDKEKVSSNVKRNVTDITEVEIIDCTSVETTTVSNINEALNYNKFGDELVLKLPTKPVNKIKFNVNKKSLVYVMFYCKSSNIKEIEAWRTTKTQSNSHFYINGPKGDGDSINLYTVILGEVGKTNYYVINCKTFF